MNLLNKTIKKKLTPCNKREGSKTSITEKKKGTNKGSCSVSYLMGRTSSKVSIECKGPR